MFTGETECFPWLDMVKNFGVMLFLILLGIKRISAYCTSTGKPLDIFFVFGNWVHLLLKIAVVSGMLVKFNHSNCCLFIKKKIIKNNQTIVAWFQIQILRYLRYLYYYLKGNLCLTYTQKIGSSKNLDKFFRRNRAGPKNLTVHEQTINQRFAWDGY